MALFHYQGYDAEGHKVNGSCEGGGQRAVIADLRKQGIFVRELIAENERKDSLLKRFRKQRVATEDLAIATRQLASLLGGGLSLDLSLETVAGQLEQATLRTALQRVKESVIQGEALHLALAAEGGLFPPIYLSMVEVGENSGTLDQALNNLSDLLEEQARLQSKITAALAYPLLMAFVGCGVLLFLVGFVLPKVTRMLVELDQVLPLPTRLLIGLSGLIQNYGWLLIILLVAALLLARRWAATEKGRLTLDRLRLRLPLSGKLSLLIATSRFSRTLSTLISGGLPLLRALEITGRLLGNRVLQQAVTDAGRQVREGAGLAAPLQAHGLFPPLLTQMIAVGEKSGELDQMLMRVANTCDQQIELKINRLLALLEPVMILVMGGIVGFIVLAILLPIFQASQALG